MKEKPVHDRAQPRRRPRPRRRGRRRSRGGTGGGARARHPEPDLPGDATAEPHPPEDRRRGGRLLRAASPAAARRREAGDEGDLGYLLRVLRLDRPRGVGRGRGGRRVLNRAEPERTALETVGWVGDAASGFVRLIDQTRLPGEFV